VMIAQRLEDAAEKDENLKTKLKMLRNGMLS
jgi:hypothetical protein